MLFGDAIALPPLIGKFFHADVGAVEKFKVEMPSHDHMVAVDKNRPDALRGHLRHPGQEFALVRHKVVASSV